MSAPEEIRVIGTSTATESTETVDRRLSSLICAFGNRLQIETPVMQVMRWSEYEQQKINNGLRRTLQLFEVGQLTTGTIRSICRQPGYEQPLYTNVLDVLEDESFRLPRGKRVVFIPRHPWMAPEDDAESDVQIPWGVAISADENNRRIHLIPSRPRRKWDTAVFARLLKE